MVRPGKRSAVAIVAEIRLTVTRHNALDPELVPTDRILDRWAVSVGSGLPSGNWDDTPRSRPPPLDDQTAIEVDRIILQLPHKYKTLVVRWYKSPLPRAAIAREMGLSSRTGLYLEWRSALWYLRGRFHGVGIDC